MTMLAMTILVHFGWYIGQVEVATCNWVIYTQPKVQPAEVLSHTDRQVGSLWVLKYKPGQV